ncbi:MAG: 50S ribosomal protein L13 [Nanoarchaeota archaeon]|nr:50S ribosomal protein L13 [Nanoarchaeota archaeon]
MTRVIDAKDLIVGRLCTFLAKQLLLGETFEVVNVEKAIFTGRKEQICGRYKNLVEKGRPKSGPFIKRRSREIFKKSLKGMLPHKTTRGREALKRIKMYKGVPARLQETKTETLESANVSKVPNLKYIRLEELTKFLGGR